MTPTVLITGAAGQLGEAVTRLFVERGAQVALLARNAQAIDRTFPNLPPNAFPTYADLLDAAQTEAAVQRAIVRFGRIDALVHLAGGFRMGEPVHATSNDTWNFLFDLNARTLLNITRAVVPLMQAQERGSIVTVGAHSALKGVARMGAYCAAKSATIRLTEAMSAELRHQGINVNCVLPTIIDTPDNRAAMPDADPSLWVSPGDMARVIAFLASDDARAIHGAALPVTGLS
jgi:NAD(P)-dependent dehydrogenase (short-subunit alcohol dehydrogenase family)